MVIAKPLSDVLPLAVGYALLPSETLTPVMLFADDDISLTNGIHPPRQTI